MEASNRFSIPDRWIREVMRRESGGQQYINGRLTTSGAGAIGLMQVMPSTYEDLRNAHNLGPDPYDPHDNILAGTAYIRDMYQRFGSPAFLGAYNAGPQRLADFMSGARPLPSETVAYMAAVAPRLGPAMSSGPIAVAQVQPAPAPAAPVMSAAVETVGASDSSGTIGGRTLEAVWNTPAAPPARLPFSVGPSVAAPPVPVQSAPLQSAPTQPVVVAQPIAVAPVSAPAPVVVASSGQAGQWAVQVGAFSSPAQAQARANSARSLAHGALDRAQTAVVTTTRTDGSVLYRARLAGITADAASNACDKLAREQVACIVVAAGGDL
ncbi:MAG TPA: transglycosylase SLT domain-containing protein [Stellaceae bacterium]|nr:transglycosylase SLT domain-containing protein [Stellaceae bacterium]